MVTESDKQFQDLAGQTWTPKVGPRTLKKLRRKGIDFENEMGDYLEFRSGSVAEHLETILAFICDELSDRGISKDEFIDRMNEERIFFAIAACGLVVIEHSRKPTAAKDSIAKALLDHVQMVRRAMQRNGLVGEV